MSQSRGPSIGAGGQIRRYGIWANYKCMSRSNRSMTGQRSGGMREVYRIRLATTSDADALVEMALELQRHVERCNPRIWHPSEEGLTASGLDLVSSISNPDYEVLLATSPQQTPVAFAQGKVVVKQRYDDMIVGSVERLYVRPEHRGRGIGSALVMGLCDFFRQHGGSDISVRYVVGNQEAERFWGNLGFAPRIQIAGIDREVLVNRLGKRASPRV